jgi:broad specificity phosphatase PhoE
MGRPKNIILVRHGQSIGNAMPEKYSEMPDYKLDLTSTGIMQSREVGQKINQIIADSRSLGWGPRNKVGAYVSPYYRTRQTFENLKLMLNYDVVFDYEDPRLREQDWGHFFQWNNATVERMKWVVDKEIPIFTQDRDYVNDIVMKKDEDDG